MTNREFLNAVINGKVTEAEVEFAKAALTKLDNKNEKRRNTLSPKQEANEALKLSIVEMVQANEGVTAKAVADHFEVSTQKASALLRQLAEAGEVVGTREKKSAPLVFKAVETAE